VFTPPADARDSSSAAGEHLSQERLMVSCPDIGEGGALPYRFIISALA